MACSFIHAVEARHRMSVGNYSKGNSCKPNTISSLYPWSFLIHSWRGVSYLHPSHDCQASFARPPLVYPSTCLTDHGSRMSMRASPAQGALHMFSVFMMSTRIFFQWLASTPLGLNSITSLTLRSHAICLLKRINLSMYVQDKQVNLDEGISVVRGICIIKDSHVRRGEC